MFRNLVSTSTDFITSRRSHGDVAVKQIQVHVEILYGDCDPDTTYTPGASDAETLVQMMETGIPAAIAPESAYREPSGFENDLRKRGGLFSLEGERRSWPI